MKNTFNNCTFNTVINNNIYIDSSDSKCSNNSDSNSSLIIGTIALAGIGHFLYPTVLPMILVKAISLTKIGLGIGATVSGGLAISTIITSNLKNRNPFDKDNSNELLLSKNTTDVEILDNKEQPLLLEDNYSNIVSNDLFFKNNTKELCFSNDTKTIGIKHKKKAV